MNAHSAKSPLSEPAKDTCRFSTGFEIEYVKITTPYLYGRIFVLCSQFDVDALVTGEVVDYLVDLFHERVILENTQGDFIIAFPHVFDAYIAE